MTAVLASLRGLVRRFGPVTALAGAELEIRGGEVHGVLGENGAGKSTLLGVLGGMIRPDEGEVLIDGEAARLAGPRAAWAHGVGLVHQHFALVPTLTALENLTLGRDAGTSGLRLPLEAVRERALELTAQTGLEVPLDAKVEDLGVGDRQRVEILKALLREPRILVLDEPTAVLTPKEVDSLFHLLRGLADRGRAVVLVAHKIDEVLAVADRITVLRGGRTVMTAKRSAVEAEGLVRAMVGGEPEAAREVLGGLAARAAASRPPDSTPRDRPPEIVARLESAQARAQSGSLALRDASITVRRGEIVGIAGVEGNGQRELALVLAGRMSPERGSADVPTGVGFIPQDRTVEGIVPSFDLVENVALALQDDPDGTEGPLLDWGRMRSETEGVVARFSVTAPGVDTPAAALSGGNQQRLVVGRELLRARDLLVAENPTRGLDVSAAAFVHAEIERLASTAGGPGIVLISTDLDEVLALSHRVLVIAGGRLTEASGVDRSREGIGALMLSGAARSA